MQNHRLKTIGPALVLALGLLAPAAEAQPTAADRETARALMEEGRARTAADDPAGALRAFEAAHAIMGAPTTGLEVARTQAALGRLVEARDTALQVTRMPASPGEPAPFTRARAAAGQLVEQLRGRIPSLRVELRGAREGTPVSVAVDGAAVPRTALAAPRKVNPGEHQIVVRARGYRDERRTVRVAEGEVLPVAITLVAREEPAAGARPAEPRGERTPAWVWGTGGAGVAALAIGAGFAVDFASAQRAIDEDCPPDAYGDRVCRPGRYSPGEADALAARRDRDLGLALGLGGAGAVALGVAIFGLTAAPPGRTTKDAGSARPWVSVGTSGVTVGGRF